MKKKCVRQNEENEQEEREKKCNIIMRECGTKVYYYFSILSIYLSLSVRVREDAF